MAKRSAAEMEQKVQTLRQITGGRPFVIKELPNDILSRLGYASENGLYQFIHRLSTGESQCGRRLNQVGHHGQYAWLASLGDKAQPVQSLVDNPQGVNHPISNPPPQVVLPQEPQQPTDLQKVVEENQRLQQEVGRLEEENQQLRDQVAQNKEYIQYIESENINLSARIGSTLKEQEKEKTKKQEVVNQFLQSLPRAFIWREDRGAIVYKKKFLEKLVEFSQEEQKRIVEQLEVFGQSGFWYSSLKAKKMMVAIPHSPRGCMASRATDEIRFTWQKKGGHVVVYWLYRKGDSRVRESES